LNYFLISKPHQVLGPTLKKDLKYFQQLANQEMLLIKEKDGAVRNPIGFF
jgi:hypothetical protein